MMKIRKGLLVLVAATTLLTSCLNSTDRVLEPFAAITNFSVGNFKVWYRDINIHRSNASAAISGVALW